MMLLHVIIKTIHDCKNSSQTVNSLHCLLCKHIIVLTTNYLEVNFASLAMWCVFVHVGSLVKKKRKECLKIIQEFLLHCC